MNLLRTGILNGIAVFIKTATMFVLNKILAVYVGPSGYAAIGQFQNFIQMVTTFSGNAINTGVVKYTAEYYDDKNKQLSIWQTAGSIVLSFTVLLSVLIIISRKYLSHYIFHSENYQSVFIWFAVFLIFFSLNALFLAVLNGKKEILKLVIANISGSLISLAIVSILVIKYGLYGALMALSIYQSIAFLATFLLCYRSAWFKITHFFGRIEKVAAKKLAAFALMALTSAICIPGAQIAIRTYLSYQFGLNYAGYWEAMNRLSNAYLMLVTTTLGVYYLPRLAELRTQYEIKSEVLTGYKYIFPLALFGGIIIYLCRDIIIAILFSKDFAPMRDLFFWQMIGDSLKIGSWILAYLMLGKAMTKLFISTEIIFALSSILLTYLCTQYFNFKGVAIAHMLNYAAYWLIMSFFVFKELKNINNKK